MEQSSKDEPKTHRRGVKKDDGAVLLFHSPLLLLLLLVCGERSWFLEARCCPVDRWSATTSPPDLAPTLFSAVFFDLRNRGDDGQQRWGGEVGARDSSVVGFQCHCYHHEQVDISGILIFLFDFYDFFRFLFFHLFHVYGFNFVWNLLVDLICDFYVLQCYCAEKDFFFLSLLDCNFLFCQSLYFCIVWIELLKIMQDL